MQLLPYRKQQTASLPTAGRKAVLIQFPPFLIVKIAGYDGGAGPSRISRDSLFTNVDMFPFAADDAVGKGGVNLPHSAAP